MNNKVYKNSDGGFYTSIKLEPSKNLGTKVKKGQLISYDPMSYSVNCGHDDNATYNQGTLVKIAIITSDKGMHFGIRRFIQLTMKRKIFLKISSLLIFSMIKSTNKVFVFIVIQ